MRPLQDGLKQLNPGPPAFRHVSFEQQMSATQSSQQSNEPAPSNANSAAAGCKADTEDVQRDQDQWAAGVQAKQAQADHLDSEFSPHAAESKQLIAADPSSPAQTQLPSESPQNAYPAVPGPERVGLDRLEQVWAHGMPHAQQAGSPSVASDVSSQMGNLDFLAAQEPGAPADQDVSHFDIPIQRESRPASSPRTAAAAEGPLAQTHQPISLTAQSGDASLQESDGKSTSIAGAMAALASNGHGTPPGHQQPAETLQQHHHQAPADVEASIVEHGPHGDQMRKAAATGNRSPLAEVPSASTDSQPANPSLAAMHQQRISVVQSRTSAERVDQLYGELMAHLRGQKSAQAITMVNWWHPEEFAAVFARDMDDDTMLLVADAFKVGRHTMMMCVCSV